MAALTNTATTYGLRGQKESYDKKIYNKSPEETLFASSLTSEEVDAREHNWQEDSYANANKDNARVEGDEFAGNAIVPTFILRNVHQTFTKDIITSGLANRIAKYGRGDEQPYQVDKATTELLKDVEAGLLSNNIGVVGSNPTASKVAGLELYSDLNVSSGVGGSTTALVNATLPVVAPVDGTQRALTEAIFTATLRGMWENGGTPRSVYSAMSQKAVMNAFPGIANRQINLSANPNQKVPVFGVVVLYDWETGPIALKPLYADRIRARTLFVTDDESVKRTFIRPLSKKVIAPSGDAMKTMLLTDVSLKVTNRRGIAKIADLT
jgi:Family of unknown function (DUF5309)